VTHARTHTHTFVDPNEKPSIHSVVPVFDVPMLAVGLKSVSNIGAFRRTKVDGRAATPYGRAVGGREARQGQGHYLGLNHDRNEVRHVKDAI